MKKFTSSLDQTATIIPYAMVTISLVIFIISFIAYKKTGGEVMVLIFFPMAPVLIIGLLIAMYFLKPLSVIVDNNSITIERKMKPVTIPFTEIKTIRQLQKEEMAGAIRTFGNGGVYGYTGLYYNKKMGSMTWYCTQRKNYVLIEKADGKKLIVTPDNAEDMMQYLHTINPSAVAL